MDSKNLMGALENTGDLEKLFVEYSDLLYKYVFLRVGYSRELAEDLTQEAFKKAWEKRNTFNPERSSAKTWLFSITRNLIIDSYRSKSFEVFDEDYDIDSSNFENNLINQIDYKLVLNKINELKEVEKDLIIFRFIEEMEYREISKIMKRSEVWVRVNIFRAIKKLRKLVTNE